MDAMARHAVGHGVERGSAKKHAAPARAALTSSRMLVWSAAASLTAPRARYENASGRRAGPTLIAVPVSPAPSARRPGGTNAGKDPQTTV